MESKQKTAKTSSDRYPAYIFYDDRKSKEILMVPGYALVIPLTAAGQTARGELLRLSLSPC